MGQTTTWIVVANASQARLYESRGRAAGLALIQEFEHPQSRAKAADLITDRPGHAASSRGGRRTAYEPNTEVHRHEHDRFAQEIAQVLGAAHATNRYDKVVLTASSAFLGMLKSHLPKTVARALLDTIDKDYTASSEAELAGILHHILPA